MTRAVPDSAYPSATGQTHQESKKPPWCPWISWACLIHRAFPAKLSLSSGYLSTSPSLHKCWSNSLTWSCPFSNSDLGTNWSIQYFRRIHCHLPTSELFYLLRTHVKSLPGTPIFYSVHSWFTIACTPDSYSTFILKFPSDQIIHVVNSHCACDATSWRNTAVELSVTIY